MFKRIATTWETRRAMAQHSDKINAIIKEHYSIYSRDIIISTIRNVTGLTLNWSTIRQRACLMNLTRTVRDGEHDLKAFIKWTKPMVATLRQLWAHGSEEQILQALSLTQDDWGAIQKKAHYLSLSRLEGRDGRVIMSHEEEALFSSLYPFLANQKLAVIFYDHSISSLEQKASVRGLKKNFFWTEEKKEILRKKYSHETKEALVELLGSSWENIRQYAWNLGLHRNPEASPHPRDYTANEIRAINLLYATEPYYKLYFSLPKRSLKSISIVAKQLGLKREYNPQLTMPEEIVTQITSVRKKLYPKKKIYNGERHPLAEILAQETSLAAIVQDLNQQLHNLYFERILSRAALFVSFKERSQNTIHAQAIHQLACDAFYGALVYTLNWPTENFLEVIDYFLKNKNKLLRENFGISNLSGISWEPSLDDETTSNIIQSNAHASLGLNDPQTLSILTSNQKQLVFKLLSLEERHCLDELAQNPSLIQEKNFKQRYIAIVSKIESSPFVIEHCKTE